jgi:hypothetical protein
MSLTPQAMLKARFSELAESLNIDLIVRRQTGKFYFTVTGSQKNTDKFIQGSFPGAWMTSGSGDEVVYGLPLEAVESILSKLHIDPDWLKHNDSTALQIAQKIREEGAFDHLPILADALEEAGCTLTGILSHCRASTRHKQTCWVVELLLGPKRKRKQNSQQRLEDFYTGDNEFHQFAVTCESEWAKCTDQDRLLSAVDGDLDLAITCHYHLGEGALEWLDSVVPALEGFTPRQCLKSEKLRRRLKECLWRMP